MPYGRDQMNGIADDLVAHGCAVWNMEYRRLGSADAAWPAILDDVAAGIDHLAELQAEGIDIDLDRVIVAGHSAGGHLALWAGAHTHAPHLPSARVRVLAAAGLAPIADLAEAFDRKVGGDVVAEFLGGAPSRYPDRLRASSPIAMLPLRARQLIVHGRIDDAVPIDLSRSYAAAATAAGDDVEFVELAGTGHMDFLDPHSEAHTVFRAWLLRTIRRSE